MDFAVMLSTKQISFEFENFESKYTMKTSGQLPDDNTNLAQSWNSIAIQKTTIIISRIPEMYTVTTGVNF